MTDADKMDNSKWESKRRDKYNIYGDTIEMGFHMGIKYGIQIGDKNKL